MSRRFGGGFEKAFAVVEKADDEEEGGNNAENGGEPVREDESSRVVDGGRELEREKAFADVCRVIRAELAEEEADGPENVDDERGVVAPALELEKANAAGEEDDEVDGPNPTAGWRVENVREEHGRNSAEDKRPGKRA